MMKNKKIKNILVLLLALTFIFPLISTIVMADPSSDIEVNIEVGYDGFYKYDYLFPVQVEVMNSGEDIDGKIQILLPEQIRDKEVYTAFTQNFKIAKGSTKKVNFPLEMKVSQNKIIVRIIDNKDNILWEDEYRASRAEIENTVSIGVLSDDVESLTYFNVVLFDILDGTNRVRDSKVSDLTKYIPEDWQLLEQFDIVVINNYDTERLNDKQISALKTWTEKGGFLVIGTGPNYQKTLKGLDDLNYIQAQGTEKINANILYSTFNSDNPSSDNLTIIKADHDEKDVLLSTEKTPLVFDKKMGVGSITIIGFDIGISPFIDWKDKEDFMEELLQDKMSPREGNTNNQIVGTYPSYNRFNNILQYIPMDKSISTKLILGLLIMFILIIGPINYIVLKKLDKREKGWITIPAIVLAFSLVIYFWGFRTGFDKPLVNSISVVRYLPNTSIASVESTSSVLSFSNGDVKISLESDGKLSLPSDDRSSYNYNQIKDKEIAVEYIIDNKRELVFRQRGVWDLDLITTAGDIKLDGPINNEFYFKEGKIVGEIENLSQLNIEEAVFIYGNNYKRIGDINKNDKVTVEAGVAQSANNAKRYYDLVNNLYPWSNINSDKENILNDRVKREILESYMGEFAKEIVSNNLMIIGWSKNSIGEEVTVNDVVGERLDRNLILIPINIKYESGNEIEIPYGILKPNILDPGNMAFDINMQSFHGSGSVEFGFKAEEKIDMNTMNIDIINGSFASQYDITIYNYETKKWDAYSSSSLVIDDTNRNEYYSDGEGTKIRIGSTGNRREILVPTFSVKGVVK